MSGIEDDDLENEDELREERAEGLRAAEVILQRLVDMTVNAPLFSRLGRPLLLRERKIAEAFLAALGFPDSDIAPVNSWDAAAVAAESGDVDSNAWEATEVLRASLAAEAGRRCGADLVEATLAKVIARTARQVEAQVRRAATDLPTGDEQLLNAAAGGALRAIHNAALLLLAGEDSEHAAALEFSLYLAGRWPVALTGRTLHLF